jgi:glycosyltransferase involved in cell wall biosynthesis
MSAGSPLVSILVPAYNAGRYLEDLCRSILAQKFQNLEVLIANDGSTDNTLEVLASFQKDPRFQVLSWEKNRGLSQANLALFEAARGEFWCNPGADDMLAPDFIQERLNLLNTNPGAVMVHGPAKMINELGEPAGDLEPKINFPAELDGARALRVLLQHNIIQNPSVMVRTSITKSLLPYLSCDWTYAPDWYFWILHLAAGSSVLWDPRLLHNYRIHPQSLTMNPSKSVTRQAETRLVPLCALSRAAQFSNDASQCWRTWRNKLYHLWLRRACNLARRKALIQEWLELGAGAYYRTPSKGASLGAEVRKHFLGIVLTSWNERRALKKQRFHVSGIAQMRDPLFE